MPPTSTGDRGYKRSWKNLLINKRYQLSFTLFMVGLSAALMVGLGVWVMMVANETTEVSKTSVRGTPCPKIPEIAETEDTEPVRPVPMTLDEPAGSAASDAPTPPAAQAEPAGAGSGEAVGSAVGETAGEEPANGEGDEAGERRATIQLDQSSITMLQPTRRAPAIPADFGRRVVEHWTCELRLQAKLGQLERGRMRILWVLIGTGLLLVCGLAIYGIKMTHKVAGPLFKVGLYLSKMREGRFDKVYSLRKGDQLVDFYEHFKHAHAGVVTMQQDDIARLRTVIAAAEAAGAGGDDAIDELREILDRKEKSLE